MQINACVLICLHLHACSKWRVYVCVHVHLYTCMCLCMYMCVCARRARLLVCAGAYAQDGACDQVRAKARSAPGCRSDRHPHSDLQSRASRCVRAPLVARACVRVLVVRTGLCLCFLVYMCISPSFSVSSKIFVHSTSCRRSGCRPTAYVFFWGVTIFSTVPEL